MSKHLTSSNLFVILAFLLFLAFSQMIWMSGTVSAVARSIPPTPAPMPTSGPPQTPAPFSGPYLDKPLTKQEAVQKAFEYDKRWAVWDKPWSAKLPLKENGRIQVKSFPKRGFDGSTFGPGQEDGPVWVVTINGGKVKMSGPGARFNLTHGSISYIFAKKTGHFLGWKARP